MAHTHPLDQAITGVTDEMLAQAAAFLEARRAKHGDLRMEATDSGDGAQDDSGHDADNQSDDGQDDGTDKLGDAGKQALDRMKGERNAARAELRAFKKLGLTPEQIEALQKPADDGDKPDVEKIREQARQEARAEAQRERVVDKIEAKAAKDFADPEDAVAILLRAHKPDDFLNGEQIDVEEIEEALKELLEKKPHLAAAQRGRFTGGADQGTRDSKKKPAASLDEAIAARIAAGKSRR